MATILEALFNRDVSTPAGNVPPATLRAAKANAMQATIDFVREFLMFLVDGSAPGWIPPEIYVTQIAKGRAWCVFQGAALPRGNRWWICILIEPSGNSGEIEVRCGALTNLVDKEPAIRKGSLPTKEASRFLELMEAAATKRGAVWRPQIRDGFPANVRLSLRGRTARFRCNLAKSPPAADARIDLAEALLAFGSTMIDNPAAYREDITYARVTRRGKKRGIVTRLFEWFERRQSQ